MPDHVDDRFEWDIDKSDRCLRERGFDFAYVSQLFDAKTYYEDVDDRQYDEERNRCIGLIGAEFFTVIYTPRNVRKRLIAARRSSLKEIQIYARYAGISARSRSH